MGKLVLIRHGESEWNLLGKWTGWTDISLTEKGASDARKMGEILRKEKLEFDEIFTSKLKRTQETAQNILETQGQKNLELQKKDELNERDYGEYTGMNKWEVKEKVGEEKFNAIRRNFTEPIPGGETLRDVFDRVVPWFVREILPKLKSGENILLVAHGNSLRALVKFLEKISDEDIAKFEMTFGVILAYDFSENDDFPIAKKTFQAEISPTKA